MTLAIGLRATRAANLKSLDRLLPELYSTQSYYEYLMVVNCLYLIRYLNYSRFVVFVFCVLVRWVTCRFETFVSLFLSFFSSLFILLWQSLNNRNVHRIVRVAVHQNHHWVGLGPQSSTELDCWCLQLAKTRSTTKRGDVLFSATHQTSFLKANFSAVGNLPLQVQKITKGRQPPHSEVTQSNHIPSGEATTA